MRILINKKNEIIDYAIVGSLDGDFEIDDSIVPQGFIVHFKPSRYLYKEGTIEVNNDFEDENEINLPTVPPTIVAPGTDEELRVMFATMQVQLVQANTMVMQLSKQNSQLSQELVRLNQAIDDIKEVDKDENAISEI
ncbi:DUF2977 domain-containing protein [Staphylococcus saprophyticus]|uniref:DUF2977 domain-containing protein n=1 Tax=Staphylococcus saprophyticus TaxID=29385 RepID=UPI00085366DB|nr:DUF2977 domain-containing protein [Staphylococcus saprophyticus]MDW3859265.1 DUF2977 domain-containing protein [Staphylococcus saprophyticus]OEK29889.1 hypothetical protein ASS86_08985 [Staphylococcus saprophyticus]